MKTKQELRSEAKQWRSMLSQHDVMHVSRHITDQLEALDWSDTKTVHVYLPIRKNNEIDTINFIHWLWAEQPHIAIYTPVYDKAADSLGYLRYTHDSNITIDDMGIPTIQSGLADDGVIQFDRIIVPTLVTDTNNHRIGYGAGIYDTFLATQLSAEKIGLSYKNLQTPAVPVEEHDVALDLVLLG